MHEDVVWVDNGKHVRTWKVFWIAYVHKLSTRTMYIFCQAFLHNGESGMLNWPWMCLIVLVVHAAQASKVKTCRFSTYPRNWLHRRSEELFPRRFSKVDLFAAWCADNRRQQRKLNRKRSMPEFEMGAGHDYTMIYNDIYIYVHNIYIYILYCSMLYDYMYAYAWACSCTCRYAFLPPKTCREVVQ